MPPDGVPIKHTFTAEVPAGSFSIEKLVHGETRINLIDANVVIVTEYSDGARSQSIVTKVDVFGHTFEDRKPKWE